MGHAAESGAGASASPSIGQADNTHEYQHLHLHMQPKASSKTSVLVEVHGRGRHREYGLVRWPIARALSCVQPAPSLSPRMNWVYSPVCGYPHPAHGLKSWIVSTLHLRDAPAAACVHSRAASLASYKGYHVKPRSKHAPASFVVYRWPAITESRPAWRVIESHECHYLGLFPRPIAWSATGPVPQPDPVSHSIPMILSLWR